MPLRSAAVFAIVLLAPLAVAQTYEGTLAAGDDQLPAGEYVDVYSVDVAPGGAVEAVMTSSTFDTYLVVVAPDGTQQDNDDAGSTGRSHLRVEALEGGTYRIAATSYAAGETGPYRLDVSVTDGTAPALGKASATVTGPPTPAAPPAPTAARAGCVTSAPVARRPLHARGVVTNCAGQPLAGVEVRAAGVTAAGERVSLSTETDAQGHYAFRVPDGFYRVVAEHHAPWQGRSADFDLAPSDGNAEQQDAAVGITENLVWRLSGLRPGETAGEPGAYGEGRKYYGAEVHVKSEEHGFSGLYFPAGSTLAITLTPQGPLVDGSAGAPLTFQRTFDRDVTSSIHWYLTDIPVGAYRLTATLTEPDGTAAPVGVKPSLSFSASFGPSVDVPFTPSSFGDIDAFQITVQTRDREEG